MPFANEAGKVYPFLQPQPNSSRNKQRNISSVTYHTQTERWELYIGIQSDVRLTLPQQLLEEKRLREINTLLYFGLQFLSKNLFHSKEGFLMF